MIIKQLAVGPIMANCFIIGDEGTRTGAIIDPGDDPDRIIKAVRELDLTIAYIIATHGHFDHIGGLAGVKQAFDVPILAHEGDLSFFSEATQSARNWGFSIEQPPVPDKHLADGETISMGACTLKIIHTPGHSPGSICLYEESSGAIFVGDTLFRRSIGRTDLRMGSFPQIEQSIKTRLYTLPDSVTVHTGHGPDTTIGEEKRQNQFVRP